MTDYILRRIAYFVAVLFLVTMVTFSVALLLPGDPALAYIGEANMRDKVMYETMRKELGQPHPVDDVPDRHVAVAVIAPDLFLGQPARRHGRH